MNTIITGSSAIKYWFPDFPREPKDVDLIHFGLSSAEIWKLKGEYDKPVECSLWGFNPFNSGVVLSPVELTTLKASHLCWNINWNKHMFDLQFLLKKGCKINLNLFFELYAHWNKYHGKNKRSDLKMSKDNFFDNAINYDSGEHDELHKILNPIPVYTLCLKDRAEVELDENKFNSLPHEQKLDFVREEVMVMAYERYREMDYRTAYSRMLKKFIISHAPLFSLIFILENYIELHKPKINYLKQLNHGLQNNQ